MEISKTKQFLSKRPSFIFIGLINFVIFHYAIFRLWFFLFDSSNRASYSSFGVSLAVNTALILFFSAPHSFLLSSKIKKFLLKYIPQSLYSTFYGLHASIGIILMDQYWGDWGGDLYRMDGQLRIFFTILYCISWGLMFWSMFATGLFRQSGIEEWWKKLNGQKIENSLLKDGPYRICRHPIYASFFAMIWLTPNMSYDRFFVALSWSGYILIGARLKESRLRRNSLYREYAREVPSFPFLPKGIDRLIIP
jgi:methanethiol S-methyltransferase